MNFRTDSLPFACYLYATGKLRFLRCELANGSGRIAFVFCDPEQQGENLNILFESGAEAPAATYFDSIRHLRRVMDKSTEYGEQSNENDHRISRISQ
jgi:hypothetical protein